MKTAISSNVAVRKGKQLLKQILEQAKDSLAFSAELSRGLFKTYSTLLLWLNQISSRMIKKKNKKVKFKLYLRRSDFLFY